MKNSETEIVRNEILRIIVHLWKLKMKIIYNSAGEGI
jgi:hypothetical protein